MPTLFTRTRYDKQKKMKKPLTTTASGDDEVPVEPKSDDDELIASDHEVATRKWRSLCACGLFCCCCNVLYCCTFIHIFCVYDILLLHLQVSYGPTTVHYTPDYAII